MVNPSVGLPQTRVELADVIRQFAPEYTAMYGQQMMPSQKKALSDIAACCTRQLGDDFTTATTATRRSGATTAVATGLVPNVTPPKPRSGSASVKPNCCPATIFMRS